MLLQRKSVSGAAVAMAMWAMSMMLSVTAMAQTSQPAQLLAVEPPPRSLKFKPRESDAAAVPAPAPALAADEGVRRLKFKPRSAPETVPADAAPAPAAPVDAGVPLRFPAASAARKPKGRTSPYAVLGEAVGEYVKGFINGYLKSEGEADGKRVREGGAPSMPTIERREKYKVFKLGETWRAASTSVHCIAETSAAGQPQCLPCDLDKTKGVCFIRPAEVPITFTCQNSVCTGEQVANAAAPNPKTEDHSQSTTPPVGKVVGRVGRFATESSCRTVGGARIDHEAVRYFVKGDLFVRSQNRPDLIRAQYATSVDYYNQGVKDREFVVSDRVKLAATYNQTLASPIEVAEDCADGKQNIKVRYSVKRTQRDRPDSKAAGCSVAMHLTLVPTGSQLTIVAENGVTIPCPSRRFE